MLAVMSVGVEGVAGFALTVFILCISVCIICQSLCNALFESRFVSREVVALCLSFSVIEIMHILQDSVQV